MTCKHAGRKPPRCCLCHGRKPETWLWPSVATAMTKQETREGQER